MLIAIGSDHHGFHLKEEIKGYLINSGHEVTDFGCSDCGEVDYPDVAFKVADEIGKGAFSRGILICGTGLGVAIAACKVPGIRATVCHDTYSAERSRKSNNAQVLALGAKVVGTEVARKVVEAWMNAEFTAGGSERKIQKIMDQEMEYLRRGGYEEADQ